MLNVTRIPAPNVPISDNYGVISREWFRFFQNIFLLVGGGKQNATLVGPTTVTVSASPFLYVNTSGGPLEVVVSGGGVTKMELSRDRSTFVDTGSYYGMFMLAPDDVLRITYMAAPTITAVPQ